MGWSPVSPSRPLCHAKEDKWAREEGRAIKAIAVKIGHVDAAVDTPLLSFSLKMSCRVRPVQKEGSWHTMPSAGAPATVANLICPPGVSGVLLGSKAILT